MRQANLVQVLSREERVIRSKIRTFFHCNTLVKEKNGVAFKPSSLTYFQRSVQRHLNTKGSTVNLLNEVGFKLSWEVLKALRGSEDSQLWSSLREAECFIPLLEQLTINAIRISITKYSKAIVLMNQNLHSTLLLNTSKTQAIIEPRSLL